MDEGSSLQIYHPYQYSRLDQTRTEEYLKYIHHLEGCNKLYESYSEWNDLENLIWITCPHRKYP